MDRIRTEIWDFVYKSGPQTVVQIAEKLRLNHETVNAVIDHAWFSRQGDTVLIATNEVPSVDS